MTEKKDNSNCIRKNRLSKTNIAKVIEAAASIPPKNPRVGDDVYFLKRRLGCPYCKTSRPKVYSNLRKLRYHFTYVHKVEAGNLIESLAILIKKGVLL